MRTLRLTSILLAFVAACSSPDDGPVVVGGAIVVSAGIDGSCAIGAGGGLACWGAAPFGSPEDTSIGGPDLFGAAAIAAPVELIGVSLGWAGSGCAIGSNKQAYCWGQLYESDVGNSIGSGIQPLAGMSSLLSIAVGRNVLCGTRDDRGVRCVGWYTGGGRGTDSITDPTAFDLTPNGLKPSLLAYGTAIGIQFGCALQTDSLVACWGERFRGQLGGAQGDTLQDCGFEAADYCQPGPAVVAGGHKYRQVAAGQDRACAVRIDGGVDCWGRKTGVALTSAWGDACAPLDGCLYAPTPVALPASALRVSLGADHTCALLNTGDVYCWGDNTRGQLGRPGAASLVPVAVSGGFTFTTLSAGLEHTCAIEAGSRAIGCWGANDTGQLGDGTLVDRDHPVAVVAAE